MSLERMEPALRRAESIARSRGLSFEGEEAEVGADPGPPLGVDAALPVWIWVAYQDSSGARTERTITLRQVWRDGATVQVRGWCHVRRALRTFRGDRIAELVCLATGEAPDDPAAWLADHALFDATEQDADWTRHALRACRDDLAVLAYVAHSDGVLDPDEVEVAVDHVMMSTDRDINRAQAEVYVRRLAPDDGELAAAARRLASRPEADWLRLCRSARRLIHADRQVAIGESVAWAEVERAYLRAGN